MELMYPAYNSRTTQLTADISAAQGTIPVADATIFPIGPNYATIGTENDAEVVLYETVDIEGGWLTGVQRGKSFTAARGWLCGSEVYHSVAADNMNAMMQNVQQLAAGKADLAGPTFTGQPTVGNAQTPMWHAGNLPVEQGRWTPALRGTTTAGTWTYTAQYGYYCKVGKIVTLSIGVGTNAMTGATGMVWISGLPFMPLYSNYGGSVEVHRGISITGTQVGFGNGSSPRNELQIYVSRLDGMAYTAINTTHINPAIFALYGSYTYIAI